MKIGLKPLYVMLACAVASPAAIVAPGMVTQAQANSVKIVVDGQPITSDDITHRVNFLRLQHKKGDLRKMAKDQMVEQKLKVIAIGRMHAAASTGEVDAAYARFAQSNHLTPKKLTAILAHAGVGAEHFKRFIRVQISWQRVVQQQGKQSGDTRDLVSKMLEKGNEKPSTTEYILQQVIFLVPKSGGSVGARKRQAEAMRDRFSGCDTTRDFAARLRNVAVRDLGRIMQPELPPDWKAAIEKTPQGKATPVHVTKRGVEFIGICSARKVSDDLAAETIFNSRDDGKGGGSDEGDKLLEQMRKHASISYH